MAAQSKKGVRLFVYALCEPDGKTVRYIGVTGNLWKRLHSHYSHSTMADVKEWINSLRQRGLVPAMIVLREVVGMENGIEAEAEEIKKHVALFGDKILNQRETGQGLRRQRRHGLVEFGGKRQSFADWAKELGISRQALDLRLQKHPLEIALTKTKQMGVALGTVTSPPRFDNGSDNVVIGVTERFCVKRGLTHEERRQRRIEIANAVKSGAFVADVAKAYGITEATVHVAIKEAVA